MASEPMECQVLVLRVSIHCEGCKKKVKKVLQNVNGVFKCDIDARSNKVTVQASTKLDPYFLVAKLRKSGKQAELWPEQPPPPQQQPAESQSQGDEPSKPAEKPAPENAEASAAAEPSNPQPSPEPKQNAAGGEIPKPAEEKTEASNAEATAGDGAPPEAGQQQPSEAKGKARQQQQPEERHPVNARVTVQYDDRSLGGGGYAHRMPPPQAQQPVHVMSYNVARPSASASYYAAAPEPEPMPMPMVRPGLPLPSQAAGYSDEHHTPSYHHVQSTPYEYEPYYYPPQPSPYRYQYQQQQYGPSAAEDGGYYYGAPPQRSAFSPPRDGYGEMFNDENANSCSVM